MRKRFTIMGAALLLAVLLASCGGAGGAAAPETTLTDAFRQFLAERKTHPQTARVQTEEGITYALDGGILRACDAAGAPLWQSQESWYVEDFRVGDVDGDGGADLLLSLWKSYSFGARHPARMENGDEAVRCHLFLYTLRGGRMKQLWASSSLPRPILSFELSFDGEKTPVASGAVLRTVEGSYGGGFTQGDARAFAYAWEGWGFVPQ